MMDDRGEHGGRSAHSSVGGIYTSNRAVSTRLRHLPEREFTCACAFNVFGDVWPPLAMCKMFSLQRLIIQPPRAMVCISSRLPSLICAKCMPSRARSVRSCLLFLLYSGVFKASALISVVWQNIFIVISCSNAVPGSTWGLDNAKRRGGEAL